MPYIKRIVSLQLEHFSSQNMDAQCLLMSGCSKCLPSQHTQKHRCTAAWRAPLMYIPKLCCMLAHPGACQRCKMPRERDPGCGRARCGRPAPGAQQSARCRRTKPILQGAAAAGPRPRPRAHTAAPAPRRMAWPRARAGGSAAPCSRTRARAAAACTPARPRAPTCAPPARRCDVRSARLPLKVSLARRWTSHEAQGCVTALKQRSGKRARGSQECARHARAKSIGL